MVAPNIFSIIPIDFPLHIKMCIISNTMIRNHKIKPRFTGHCRTVGPHMEVTSCHLSYTYNLEETPGFWENLWTPDLETFLHYPIEPFTQHLKVQIYVILGILSITLHILYRCVCVCVCVCMYIYIYTVSQEECARLREGVPYVKVYRYNPKHLCKKLNGYRDNGQRILKLWQLLHTYWLPNTY